MEAPPGFEPGVKALQASALPLGYSALLYYIIYKNKYVSKTKDAFVKRLYGAEDEIRTRDVHLGKVTLYH